MLEVRVLQPADEPALQRFLARHPDTTMFFRSNLATSGITERAGERYSGVYVGVVEGSEVLAVAAHYQIGNLLLEAPVRLDEVSRLAVERSGRPVLGIVGPYAQVVQARTALGLNEAKAFLDQREQLFALRLAELMVPPALAKGEVRCRCATVADLPTLVPWRVAYDVEALGVGEAPEVWDRAKEGLAAALADQRLWVLQSPEGELLAMTGFNAVTPDCVQVGGVYSPPGHRGRGYARAAVAGSLLDARGGGAERSILFTGGAKPIPGHYQGGEARVYTSLGYEVVGDYGLILFPRATSDTV